MKPFLKWAGSKYKNRLKIANRIGSGERYFEPFLGSGAMYGALESRFEVYVLNDKNFDLMNVLWHLRDNSEKLLERVMLSFYNGNIERTYYANRKFFNELPPNSVDRAALFLYLNRHGFNGLCRYNADGGFNVPFGRYASPTPPIKELKEWMGRLSKDTLIFTSVDFGAILCYAEKGDVVYCDPPYYPLSETSSFSSYTNGWKDEADNVRLHKAVIAAAERGAKVIVSNSDTPFIRNLYEGEKVETIEAHRSIAADGEKRGKVMELLITVERSQ